jgi:hypothetical protein
MTAFVQLDEETFDAIFQPICMPGTDGDNWETGAILASGIPDSRVWTIVEGDDGSLWCLPGWHLVHRFGYVVTTVSWIDSNMEGCYMEGEPHCSKCGIGERDMSGEDWCGETGRCVECCDEECCLCPFTFMTGSQCVLKVGHDHGHVHPGE